MRQRPMTKMQASAREKNSANQKGTVMMSTWPWPSVLSARQAM